MTAAPFHPAPTLTAQHVACRRGDRILFAKLSIALRAGDALHLAGPNGVGKSSLIRILSGLARPYAGDVVREGDVALLDERLALDTHWPLRRALAFWARCDGRDAEGVEQIAAVTGIDGLLDVPVRFLSTGQRRRAALARTLGRGAAIWMLDEPLNGLDTASIAMVERLIAEHCANGGIAITASHQPIAVPGMTRLNLPDFTL